MADQEIVTEQTGLTTGTPKPSYGFESSFSRQRKRRVRQFQCCICVIFLSIIVTAIVISIAYSINETNINNTTDTSNINPSTIRSDIPVDSLLILSASWPLPDRNQTRLVTINRTQFEDALDAGKKALHDREEIEKSTPKLDTDSPSYRHQKVVATSCRGRSLSRIGYAEEFATRHFNKDSKENISTICFNYTTDYLFSEACAKVSLNCNPYQKFRSYDGTCNNLKKSDSFGVAYKPFRRHMPPDYADGISSPRTSKDGSPLPSARTVSVVVHRPIYRDDPKFTVMLAVFGQFMDHDITATALNQGKDGDSISCCADNILEQHPECFPVKLDKHDPFYEAHNLTCMEFVRSAAAPTCCFGPRQQLNQASSYIDGSVVYGADEDVVKKLRTYKNGLLKMYYTEDNKSLLPISDDPYDGCNRLEETKKGRYCFMTGDARANENLHLTSMHLLWARQHNLVAAHLSKLNPNWDDERIFQEARRIIVAQIQHITYNEFLPIVLGKLMDTHELNPLKNGYYQGYNDSLDPSIANGFAASAFRFAHTLIPTLMKMMANDSASPEYVELHRMLFDPFQLYKDGEFDRTIRGAMHTHIQASDPYFTPELKEHMFERPVAMDRANSTKLCGLDLVSLNIQRGRDHGLPGYTSWRQHCALPRPHTFNQLVGAIDDESLNYIQSIYRDVDDIDFYTGALSEIPLKDGFLGPTMSCIILDQFIRLKRGDRFWYENQHKPQAFSEDQLQEIRKTSLAHIICENSDDVKNLQPLVMKRIDEHNPNKNCASISKPNLNYWRDDLHAVQVNDEMMKVGTKN